MVGKLKAAGLETIGAGKVFHSRGADTLDLSDWSEFHIESRKAHPKISKAVKAGALGAGADFGIDPTDEESYDDKNTNWIIEKILPGATGKLWALGIFRPHLPLIAPQKYFDQISEPVSLPPGLNANRFDPDNESSWKDLPNPGRKLAEYQRSLGRALHEYGEYDAFLKAYLACIAYADAKLGLVLDRLEQCNLMQDTLIVLWSDHGWQLGEKLAFRKFTLWERALRVPLFFCGGDIAASKITDPVSLVDIGPTILKLLGLPASKDFSGCDLTPLIYRTGAIDRAFAPSVWGTRLKNKPLLAFSMRSRQYRYIRYWNGGRELYDHSKDPFEHNNILKTAFALEKSGYRKVIKAMEDDLKVIEAGYQENWGGAKELLAETGAQ